MGAGEQMPPVTMTDEEREDVSRIVGETIQLAAQKLASGRSSLPISVQDAMTLAAFAMVGLNAIRTTPEPRP